jgi:hypothetical protein
VKEQTRNNRTEKGREKEETKWHRDAILPCSDIKNGCGTPPLLYAA